MYRYHPFLIPWVHEQSSAQYSTIQLGAWASKFVGALLNHLVGHVQTLTCIDRLQNNIGPGPYEIVRTLQLISVGQGTTRIC